MTKNLIAPVRQIVELLGAKDYDQIVRTTGGQRLDAAAIEAAIRGYGKTLVSPPDSIYDHLDAIRVQNIHPPRWSVRVGLWTADEGRSDLSVELTVIEDESGYVIELDDIHVL